MTATIPTSIVIVSRGRPQALSRCIKGVSQLYHPNFEIVVVADPPGLAAIGGADWAGRIKTVAFDTPNISAARNLGIGHAAGQIIAFIDDDAVPEPTWLDHLTGPFAAPRVAAAGGFVRGRNGISFQWKARDIRTDGDSRPLTVDPRNPTILAGQPGIGTKTEGTNMAFRRSVLAMAGGFDPVFRFYMDETDLNLRLAALGLCTAIVPLAQVHHGFAPSERRRADRVPTDLFQVGASQAAFLRKHHAGDLIAHRNDATTAQHGRLIGHMVAGRIEPRDLRRILGTFTAGWADGLERRLDPLQPLGDPATAFLPFVPVLPRQDHRILSGWHLETTAIMADAAALAAKGHAVSAYILAPDARYHSVRYDARGFWVQSGGLFGRSDRSDPMFGFWRFRHRLEREILRVEDVRADRL